MRNWRYLLWIVTGALLLLVAAAAVDFRASAQAGGDPSPGAPTEPLAPEMSSAHFKLEWYVIANSGPQGASAHFRVNGTVGQSVTGQDKSAHLSVCKGFWCVIRKWAISLPLVFR